MVHVQVVVSQYLWFSHINKQPGLALPTPLLKPKPGLAKRLSPRLGEASLANADFQFASSLLKARYCLAYSNIISKQLLIIN